MWELTVSVLKASIIVLVMEVDMGSSYLLMLPSYHVTVQRFILPVNVTMLPFRGSSNLTRSAQERISQNIQCHLLYLTAILQWKYVTSYCETLIGITYHYAVSLTTQLHQGENETYLFWASMSSGWLILGVDLVIAVTFQ